MTSQSDIVSIHLAAELFPALFGSFGYAKVSLYDRHLSSVLLLVFLLVLLLLVLLVFVSVDS